MEPADVARGCEFKGGRDFRLHKISVGLYEKEESGPLKGDKDVHSISNQTDLKSMQEWRGKDERAAARFGGVFDCESLRSTWRAALRCRRRRFG